MRFSCCIIGIVFLFTGESLYALMDEDGNGYSDVWERRYNASDLPMFGDPDGDGESNLMEHFAGTDPFDSESVFSTISKSVFSNELLVEWQSVAGVSYQVEGSESLMAGGWSKLGSLQVGNGGIMWRHVDSSDMQCFYRVSVPLDGLSLYGEYAALVSSDTDGDGVSDWVEWQMGTDLFNMDSRMATPVLKLGNADRLSWNTQIGKMYQIQSKPAGQSGSWENHGLALKGTGETLKVDLSLEESQGRVYSVWVYDVDSDGDGLNDWEEGLLGLRADLAKTDHLGDGDYDEAIIRLGEANRVKLATPVPIGNLTRGADGSIEFTRVSGIDRLVLSLMVGGDATAGVDYEALPTTVVLPFGERSIQVPIRLLPSADVALTESIDVTLAQSNAFEIASNKTQTVNLVSEVAVNVKDFGALGDGTTDDRLAIQAAITALENQNDKNTLYFPAGNYRLNSYLTDGKTPTSRNRILRLGSQGMDGRDIIIAFDEAAKLYSTVSPIRSPILECQAKFRSLSFYDADIEKDDVILQKPLHAEPNGADGVSLIMHDDREVSMIQFTNCRIMNCHGAISAYGRGLNVRGKLQFLRFRDCDFLCPWGANSVIDSRIWGGGQMINLAPWVGVADYSGCYFDGGSLVAVEPTKNPLDRKKDGSHFGSPVSLIFKDNIVEHMRVEAVYQLHDPLMGYTNASFAFPSEGGSVTFAVDATPSNYLPGDKIAIRGPIGGGKTESVSFTVVGYQAVGRQLTIRNDGDNSFPLTGIVFTSRKPIYKQGLGGGDVLIKNNVVRALNETGRRSSAGIVTDAGGLVCQNYVEGFTVGLQIYGNPRTPLTPGSVGTVFEDNVVYTANGAENPSSTTYGIQSWGRNDMIRNNLVFTPNSTHFMGVALRGHDTIVEDNTVIAENIMRNGYSSSLRAVGIGIGNTSVNVRCVANTTRGFDVGVGPIGASQAIPHYVTGHRSIDDVLAVDPRGVIEE